MFASHVQLSFNSHCEIISQIPVWAYKYEWILKNKGIFS